MKIEELYRSNADLLKRSLKIYLDKMNPEEQKKHIIWLKDEFAGGRGILLRREDCQKTYQTIIDNSDSEIVKDFFKYLHAFVDEYGFARSSWMASLELYQEYIDQDFDSTIENNRKYEKIITKDYK